YQMLLSPAERFLSGKKSLVIVPDGILYHLPFEALLKPVKAPAGAPRTLPPNAWAASATRYLMEDYQVGYSPSATVFALIEKRRPPDKKRKAILAFGDPAYPGETPARSVNQTRAMYELIGYEFTRLPYSGEEVDRIGRLFSPHDKVILTRSEATEQRAKSDDVKNYRILHFATH